MKDLVIIIVKYLRRELANNKLGADAAEGVEVAVQCLENAYGITPDDVERCSITLEELYFAPSFRAEANRYQGRIVTEDQKEKAEGLKIAGNQLMKEARYDEAIDYYTRAIELDPGNTVYFCNRAAAHIQTHNFHAAINDCHEAIELDPNYGKAHSRLGYAYQAIGNRDKARDSYAKALSIEPNNDSYRSCYQKLVDQGASNAQPMSELMGLLPGIDLSSIMKNPSFVQMASQMLEDPGMRNAVTRILSGQSSFAMGQVEELIVGSQQLADRLQSRIDIQPQPGSSNGQQSSQVCDSEAPMQGQGMRSQEPGTDANKPAAELGSTASMTTQPPQASVPGPGSIFPSNSVGASGEETSSTGAQGKDGQGPVDVDMGDGDSVSQ